ncbi:hypothetical protein ACA081_00900 [Candidatus Hodgkinia cicadicola]
MGEGITRYTASMPIYNERWLLGDMSILKPLRAKTLAMWTNIDVEVIF